MLTANWAIRCATARLSVRNSQNQCFGGSWAISATEIRGFVGTYEQAFISVAYL